MTIGREFEPYATIGADPKVYADYAKSFEEACSRILAKVGGLPGFKILNAEDIDLRKFWWRSACLIYAWDETISLPECRYRTTPEGFVERTDKKENHG